MALGLGGSEASPTSAFPSATWERGRRVSFPIITSVNGICDPRKEKPKANGTTDDQDRCHDADYKELSDQYIAHYPSFPNSIWERTCRGQLHCPSPTRRSSVGAKWSFAGAGAFPNGVWERGDGELNSFMFFSHRRRMHGGIIRNQRLEFAEAGVDETRLGQVRRDGFGGF